MSDQELFPSTSASPPTSDFQVSHMEEGDGAAVHGVVTDLSPIKVSRNNPEVKYFSGQLSDGVKHTQLRPAMETFRQQQSLKK